MIDAVGGIGGQISLIAVVGVYLRWLYGGEPSHKRRDRVMDALDGELFSRKNAVFRVERTSVIEKDSFIYRMKKYIPLFRSIEGVTKVTLKPKEGNKTLYTDGAGHEETAEYYWTPKSLSNFLGEGYPEVKYLKSNPTKDATEVKIQIKSMDVSALQSALEEIPAHLHQMLEEHPSRGKLQDHRHQNSDRP